MKFKKRVKRFFLGLFIFILLLVLSIVGLYIFRNPIVTGIIEKSGEKMFGAKVEVSELNIKPMSLDITWEKFQVADKDAPMKNLFETGNVAFGVEFKPLLDKKFIVEEVQVAGMQFGTKRTTSGALPPKPKPKSEKKTKKKNDSKILKFAKDKLNEEKKKIPVFNPSQLKTTIDVDQLVASVGLQTPAKVDSLEKVVKGREKVWRDRFKNNTYKKDIKQIEKDIKLIEKNTKKIKLDDITALKKLQDTQKAIKRVYKTSKEVTAAVKKDKKQFDKDLKTVKGLSKDVPKWIKEDYQKALNLANLPDVDVKNIAVMLFGDQVSDLVMKIIDVAKKSREVADIKIETVEETQDKEPKPEKYPNLPTLWIKKISLSGFAGDGLTIEGNIFDITDNQDRTKKDSRYVLNGKLPNKSLIEVNGKIKLRSTYRQEINISVSDIPIRNVELSNFELLPKKLKSGSGKMTTTTIITDEELSCNIRLDVKNINFDPNSKRKMDKRLVRISQQIANSIKNVNMVAKIKQANKDTDISIDSNLDELISQQLKMIVNQEVGNAKREVKRKIDKELNKYKSQIDNEIAKYQNQLQKEMKKYIGDVNLLEKDSKKLKKNIEKLIEDKLKEHEDDINDALKDGFNKLFG